MKLRKQYSVAFKDEVVRCVEFFGLPYAEHQFKISKNTIKTWKNKSSKK